MTRYSFSILRFFSVNTFDFYTLQNTNIIVKNFPEKDNEVTNINNILFLLKFLYEITEDKNKIKEEFICKKINAKLDQQIEVIIILFLLLLFYVMK